MGHGLATTWRNTVSEDGIFRTLGQIKCYPSAQTVILRLAITTFDLWYVLCGRSTEVDRMRVMYAFMSLSLKKDRRQVLP